VAVGRNMPGWRHAANRRSSVADCQSIYSGATTFVPGSAKGRGFGSQVTRMSPTTTAFTVRRKREKPSASVVPAALSARSVTSTLGGV
jgi:hypothetical protein